MRAVIQRVSESHVTVDGVEVGRIGAGFNVLLGVEDGDTETDLNYMVEKVINLRIFEDEDDKMNRSILDVGGSLLVISQFTLLGDARKGRRPGFTAAARPEVANPMYEQFVEKCKGYGLHVETGQFQTHMVVRIDNDGPITMLLDSRKNF